MSPELLALEKHLTDLYRDAPSIIRLAEQAGLNPSHLPTGTPIRANLWHEVIVQAISDDKLDALIAMVESERPAQGKTNTRRLYEAYKQARQPEQPASPARRAKRDTPPIMSDNWRMDGRIDALYKEVADLRTLVAEIRTSLNYVIQQSSNLEKQNRDILAALEGQNKTALENAKRNNADHSDNMHLPHDLQWYIGVAITIALVVFIITYAIGRLP